MTSIFLHFLTNFYLMSMWLKKHAVRTLDHVLGKCQISDQHCSFLLMILHVRCSTPQQSTRNCFSTFFYFLIL